MKDFLKKVNFLIEKWKSDFLFHSNCIETVCEGFSKESQFYN